MEHGFMGVSSIGNWDSWRLLSLAYKRESKKGKRDEESKDEGEDWPGGDPLAKLLLTVGPDASQLGR
jgi:hypothetical protein